ENRSYVVRTTKNSFARDTTVGCANRINEVGAAARGQRIRIGTAVYLACGDRGPGRVALVDGEGSTDIRDVVVVEYRWGNVQRCGNVIGSAGNGFPTNAAVRRRDIVRKKEVPTASCDRDRIRIPVRLAVRVCRPCCVALVDVEVGPEVRDVVVVKHTHTCIQRSCDVVRTTDYRFSRHATVRRRYAVRRKERSTS